MEEVLELTCSPSCKGELEYIADLIFKDVLGLEYKIKFVDSKYFGLKYNNKAIRWPNIFFTKAHTDWLSRETLPCEPLARYECTDDNLAKKLVTNDLPVIFGNSEIIINDDEASIGIDVLGSCFYLVSLYGEIVDGNRDERGRYPFSSSLLCRENIINRPLVNEYIELLWFVIEKVSMGLVRKERSFSASITQDVDVAFFSEVSNKKNTIKSVVGDLWKRKSISLAVKRLSCLFVNSDRVDPNNSFEFFMDTIESKGLIGEFYFIPGSTLESKQIHGDAYYSSKLKLYKNVLDRGHVIGLHPYYGSYNNISFLRQEKEYLEGALSCAQVEVPVLGGRQHGLQWEPAETWTNWDELGFKYDSSVAFAEQPGFRTSFCYAYRAYDLINRRPLDIYERPLLCMDTTYFSYLNASAAEYVESVIKIIDVCKKFNGDFVGLWHNCKLSTKQSKLCFKKIIESI